MPLSLPNGRTPLTFFPPLPAEGRRVLGLYSHLQRIGKGATTSLHLNERLLAESRGLPLWAAVRQIELFQEAGNLSVYDMEIMDMKYALECTHKMRAGGYRVAVVMVGTYDEPKPRDDLREMDRKLGEEVSQIAELVYLDKESAALSEQQNHLIRTGGWRCAEALPHLAMTRGAARLFGKAAVAQTAREDFFFRLVENLPKETVRHEVGMGLTIPSASKEYGWIYCAKGEHKLYNLHRTLATVFQNTEEAVPMRFMRAGGDRLTPKAEAQQRASLALL